MYCTACGTQAEPDDAFCGKCGRRLRRAADEGASIGGNVSTGGGNFIGRDFLKRIRVSWGTYGCINIMFITVSTAVMLLFASIVAYIRPPIITGARPTPIVLPTPLPTITSVATTDPTATSLPTDTPILTATATATAIATSSPISTSTSTPIPVSTTITPTVQSTSTPPPTFDPSAFTLSPLLLDISNPELCGEIDPSRLSDAISTCGDLNSGWICYANPTVRVFPSEIRFYEPKDRQPLDAVEEIFIDETGMVLMNLQVAGEQNPLKIAIIADTSQANETFQLMGISGSIPEFTVPVSAFQQSLSCALPLGVIFQREDGNSGSIRINGVDAIVFE